MFSRYIIVVLSFCALTSCSITKALKTGKHLSKAEWAHTGTYAFTIPFELKTGHLQLQVNINGADYLFYLDTGAPTAVSPQLARKLKVKSIRNKQGVAQNGADTLVTIDELKIGDALYENVGGISVSTGDLFKRSCVSIDGLVGANVMNENVWQIDYVNKQIIVANTTESLQHVGNAVRIPFTTAPFTKTPILALTLDNGRTVQLVYDTGFNGYVTLNTDSVDSFVRSFPSERVTESLSIGYTSVLGDSVAKVVDTSYVIQAELKSGNQVLGNVPVTYGRYKNYSDQKNGVIGNDFFKQSIVTLDWTTKTLYVYSTKSIEKSYRTWGMSYGMVDGKLTIGAIVPGLEPERLGINIGDEIMEVNGVIISTLTPHQRCDYADGTFTLVSEETDSAMFQIKKPSGDVVQARLTKH